MRRRIRGMMTTGKQFSLDSCMDMVQGILTLAVDQEMGSQDLALMKEDEHEDLLALSGGMSFHIKYQTKSFYPNFPISGSTPADVSNGSQETVSQEEQQHQSRNNQLTVPGQTNRHYRSKSVDTTLPLFQEGAKGYSASLKDELVVFDKRDKGYINGDGDKNAKTENEKTINIKCIDDDGFPKDHDVFKIDIDDEKNELNEEADVFSPMTATKAATSSASGSYLKRLLQQFSEGSFSCDDDDKSKGKLLPKNTTVKLEKSSPIRKRVDDICKKCLHYKGQVNPNQNQ